MTTEVKQVTLLEDDIGHPLPAYVEHQEALAMVEAVHGGTRIMRLAGETYLPKEEGESDMAYAARLKRSTLINYYKRTLVKLVGQAFEEDIQESKDLNPAIAGLMQDVNQEGDNINVFMADALYEAIHKGVTHIMVDYPQVSGKTREDHIKAGARPYLVRISPDNVIGWRFKKVGGKKVLTQLRVKETVEVEKGEFGMESVDRIRLYKPGYWGVYVQGKGKWELAVDPDTGQPMQGTTSLNFIPLVTFMLGEPMSDMTAQPCLDDLGELNVTHWQSSSDQRNILHYARLVTYFGKMLDPNDSGKINFGANRLVHSMMPEADLKVVEHSGKGIDAGRQDLKDLEQAMALFGLTLLLPKANGVTATENEIDKGENDSALLGWIKVMESVLGKVHEYMCAWIGEQPKGGLIPYKDLKASWGSVAATLIIEAFKAKLIPRKLALTELMARGVINQEVDLVELIAMMEEDARLDADIMEFTTVEAGQSLVPGDNGQSPDQSQQAAVQ